MAQEQKGDAPKDSWAANAKFVADLSLAVRGAFAILIVGMPFFLPKGTFPMVDESIEQGIYSSSVAIYLIFTLYYTVGQTICNAWCGMLGTLLATLTIWLMFGIFPDGVTPTSAPHVFWIGVAIGDFTGAGAPRESRKNAGFSAFQ